MQVFEGGNMAKVQPLAYWEFRWVSVGPFLTSSYCCLANFPGRTPACDCVVAHCKFSSQYSHLFSVIWILTSLLLFSGQFSTKFQGKLLANVRRDCWDYLKKYSLPSHPLHEEGFPSIGDVQTTLPVPREKWFEYGGERSGRFQVSSDHINFYLDQNLDHIFVLVPPMHILVGSMCLIT